MRRKKIMSVLVAVVMVFAAFPALSFASEPVNNARVAGYQACDYTCCDIILQSLISFENDEYIDISPLSTFCTAFNVPHQWGGWSSVSNVRHTVRCGQPLACTLVVTRIRTCGRCGARNQEPSGEYAHTCR
ncbi:MAG: hypothetical protein FWE11_00395 [Defluviitaleaceae bacterium]|nr:hypothetical protein [Defluviitaleaceae bacterium]